MLTKQINISLCKIQRYIKLSEQFQVTTYFDEIHIFEIF